MLPARRSCCDRGSALCVPGALALSIDLQIGYLRSLSTNSGPIVATGLVIKPGRRVAFARAEITDPDGRLVAAATGSCLIIDGREETSAVDHAP
ncbi:MAG TPA: PaaI family thioesterase [Acidimicrobiales bacterium]|nr:PaaI family thioesterase [Acidimicrobiales bacterium]